MLTHCNLKFRPETTWFLLDTQEFVNRRLEIAVCPVCEHKLARLVETRISDNMVFDETVSRRKANRLINSLKNQISYSSDDVIHFTKGMYGWRYGETKSKTLKDGTTTITQKAVDFYGNKEVVKKYNV